MNDKIMAARAALHMWEEPCISGTRGSGAVFFSGCSLRCIFCQNYEIAQGNCAREISGDRLSEIFLELQEQGAANINLVTATHFAPAVIGALKKAKAQGMHLPVIYNSSGYERVETVQMLEEVVDVWLPDFKYMDPELAFACSKAKDYPEVAVAAIREMMLAGGRCEYDDNGYIQKGVIVRHLILPGHTKNSIAVLDELYETYGKNLTISLMNQYEDITDDLHTDLHECLGHGSGQLLPGTDPDALKAYGSTIEEARADLFGLYYVADHKLVELGLTPNDEAYKAQYYGYLMNGLLTQTIRIKEGDKIEEAHMRNRALIAWWVMEHAEGAVELVKMDMNYASAEDALKDIEGNIITTKTYVKINDYAKLRHLFGELLAEIQRIKSEGDFEAARQLVEKYAVNIDPELHREILARYKKLNLAPYKGFINPKMMLEMDEEGEITDVVLDYEESYVDQMLRYSDEYGTL